MYLEKQEIISLIVVVILAIPFFIFLYLGLVKLVDFALVYSYTSAVVIVGVLAWGFRHRIQQIIPKTEIIPRPKSADITPEVYLDDLIHEIELFIKKWTRGSLL